jgi:starch-binding outer membrane protein, SusD/RagB family
MKKITWILFLSLIACTDLEEKILDETLGENLLTSPGAAESVVAPVYARLRGAFSDQARVFALQQHTSDETLGPTRGKDWDDNGIWRTLHQHNWDANHSYITETWNDLTQGIARANIALYQLENINPSNKEQLKAEVRFLRAFYSYYVLDFFGVLPTRDESSLDFNVPPVILNASQAVDFIATELEAIIPVLPAKGDTPYGRVTKGAAQALAARLYLNKGTLLSANRTPAFDDADMDKAISYANDVINSGDYALEDDYWSIFNVNNNTSSEPIFVVEQRTDVDVGGHNFVMMTLHYNHRPKGDYEPWNGFTTIADFYNKWDQDDPRFRQVNTPGPGEVPKTEYQLNRGFLEGQQYGPTVVDGKFEESGNNYVISPLKDRSNNPLIYTVEVPINGANEAQGVRVLKYQPDPNGGANNRAGYDIVLIRLGEVYLNRAEAKARKGDFAGAREDIDIIRDARGADLLGADPTLDQILDERGFELYWEMHRRSDLIRFGKFEEAWTEKPASSAARRLFPIPQTAIDANPELKQNTGY